MFDQNNWILQIIKETKRCDPCKNFDPRPFKCRKNIKKSAQTLVDNELLIKVRAIRSKTRNYTLNFREFDKISSRFYLTLRYIPLPKQLVGDCEENDFKEEDYL